MKAKGCLTIFGGAGILVFGFIASGWISDKIDEINADMSRRQIERQNEDFNRRAAATYEASRKPTPTIVPIGNALPGSIPCCIVTEWSAAGAINAHPPEGSLSCVVCAPSSSTQTLNPPPPNTEAPAPGVNCDFLDKALPDWLKSDACVGRTPGMKK